MPNWLSRVRNWTSVQFKDPEARAERAMVRILILIFATIAILGLADLLRSRTGVTGIQFIAATALALLALWMDRTRRAYPRTLLVTASMSAYLWIVLIVANGEYLRLTDASPTVIITFSGVMALALGGRWARLVLGFWSLLIVAAIATIRWPVTHSVAHVATDAITVLAITGLAALAVMTIRRAVLQGRDEYQRLLETAPIAVVELDLHNLNALLKECGLVNKRQLLEALQSGNISSDVFADSVGVVSYNEVAIHDLAAVNPGLEPPELKEALLADPHQSMASLLGSMLFESSSGSVELSMRPERAMHRIVNWQANKHDRYNVIMTSTDITAQKAAEEALADEIRYKDEFIASVSHELRTPLTAVVGLVDEMTRADVPMDRAERDDLLAIVAEQSHEVANIVEDLLVAAQAAGGNLSVHPIAIDLPEVLCSTLRVFEEEITCDKPGRLAAFADPARVRQIVRNLATNSIRHGGSQRRARAFLSAERAVIEIRDNGPAIPESLRKTMFDAYERTQRIATTGPESVGLGLTVAKSLALSMGGDLDYEHDGKESIFRLSLPVAPPG